MRIELVQVERTVSTNVDVRRAIDEGLPEGYAVLAREQTGGYGRRGNAWASAPGGMYLSLLLRPTRDLEEWPTLSLLAAVAVMRAVARVAPAVADVLRIKAPNDIIVGDDVRSPRKLAGILPEAHAGGVALGIGVNLSRPVRQPSVDGKNVPVYLNELAAQMAGEMSTVAGGAGGLSEGLSAMNRSTSRVLSGHPFRRRRHTPPPGMPRHPLGIVAKSPARNSGEVVSGNSEERIDAPAFAAVTLECFSACYATWQNKGFNPFAAEYRAAASDER